MIAAALLHEQRPGGVERRYVGQVQLPVQPRYIDHPRVAQMPGQLPTKLRHPAGDARRADPGVAADGQRGAEPAAREPEAADARGVDVGPADQVVDRAEVIPREKPRPVETGRGDGLGREVFVK